MYRVGAEGAHRAHKILNQRYPGVGGSKPSPDIYAFLAQLVRAFGC